MTGVAPVGTPCPDIPLESATPEDVERCKEQPYRMKVGASLFLSIVSRPDIPHAVSKVTRFLEKHGQHHMNAVDRIFKYLAGTIDIGIVYKKTGSVNLFGFADSTWGDCATNARPTTGGVFYLAGAPISWKSKLQLTVALSSVEAEYMALCDAARQAVWFRQLYVDLIGPFVTDTTTLSPTMFGEDNQGAIHLLYNPSASQRTRHINVKYHFTRDLIKQHAIDVKYVPTDKQPADILTKYLNKASFLKARQNLMSQVDPPAWISIHKR